MHGPMELYVWNWYWNDLLFEDCSNITGNLLHTILGVKEEYIFRLPMNSPTKVDNFTVTLLGE